jgi:DNA-directed RNA polymerase specialized sigma24 family protein
MDDADAFSELYRREGETVLVFLTRRTLDVEVALELTAETFAITLTSWRKLSRLADEQRRAWLFTVAARRFGRYLRRASVERIVMINVYIAVITLLVWYIFFAGAPSPVL